MRSKLPLVVLVVPLFSCGDPNFDIETSGPVRAVTHDVRVTVDRGVAELVVHRSFLVGDEPEFEHTIKLPSGGTVDLFRAAVDGEWYGGELLEAFEASNRYVRLSGRADDPSFFTPSFRPPVILEWLSDGELQLRAHPLPPGAMFEIEYRIIAPTCHLDGRPVLDYPNNEDGAPVTIDGPGTFREAKDDEMWSSACDEETTLLDGPRTVIALDALPTGIIDARLAVQAVDDRDFTRLVVDLPGQLAPLPEHATVIFLLDGSVSAHDDGLADQLAWAETYLSWVPDASVEVVVFHRFAERLFGRYLPARDFRDGLARQARYVARNGSNLDDGLHFVNDLSQDVIGEVRVVAMSDLLMRNDFDEQRAAAILREGVTLHVVQRAVRDGEAYVEESSGAYAAIPEATGGRLFEVSGSATDKNARAAIEELLRPVRLEVRWGDEVEVRERGETFRHWSTDGMIPESATVQMWSRRYPLHAERVDNTTMPALIVGTRLHHGIDAVALKRMATASGLVSPHTSYLAEFGGAPLDGEIGFLSGLALYGCGCGGSYSTCGGTMGLGRIGTPPDTWWLRQAIERIEAQCGVQGTRVRIEATVDEIVEVDGEDACVVEALWDTELPAWFDGIPRAVFAQPGHLTIE